MDTTDAPSPADRGSGFSDLLCGWCRSEDVMGYMKQWRGKTVPDDKSGEADYMVEGELFCIPLPSFEHAQRLDALLWTAFRQGKQFAFQAIKSHMSEAMQRADSAHGLTMTE